MQSKKNGVGMYQVVCLACVILTSGTVCALGDNIPADNHVYRDHIQFGNPGSISWNTGWQGFDAYVVGVKGRIDGSFGTGAGFEYDARFPVKTRGWYDEAKVVPGKTFPLDIEMYSYNHSYWPEYEAQLSPGFRIRFRIKERQCKLLPPGCSWRTTFDLGYDYQFLIQEDPSPQLCDSKVELSDTITPTPPSWFDFIVCLNLVLDHEMKERRVSIPSVNTSSNATVVSSFSPNYWNYNNRTNRMYTRVNSCGSDNEVGLTLNTEFHYKSRGDVGLEISVPALAKSWSWTTDWFGYDGGWIDNHDIPGLGPTWPRALTIPVQPIPDLRPTSLSIAWPSFQVGSTTWHLPCLKARILNQGCGDTSKSFKVGFYALYEFQGKYYWIRNGRYKTVGNLAQDDTVDVNSDPIYAWSCLFAVVVDVYDDVEEIDESNNSRTRSICSVTGGIALPDNPRLFDDNNRQFALDLPANDEDPRRLNVVTPIPDWFDDPNMPKGPDVVRGQDDQPTKVAIDFSYIYDILGEPYAVSMPNEPWWPTDPGLVDINIPAGQSSYTFNYVIWDTNTLESVGFEQLIFQIETNLPVAPSITSLIPDMSGDYNLHEVEINAPDASAVMAIVHGPDTSYEYGPFDPNGNDTFVFSNLSLFQGDNTIEFISINAAGNSNSFSTFLHLSLGYDLNDVNGPTIWPITPADSKYVAVAQPTISTFITDLVWDGNDANSGVFGSGLDAASVKITIDTNEYTTATGVEVAVDGSVTFVPPLPLPDGTYTLQVSADDLNGNQTTSPLQQFTVDTNDPLVDINSVTPPSFEPQSTGANTVTITYSLSEDAAVAITVYAGLSVDDANYRDLIYYDGYDSNGQTYSSAGSHDEVYDGLLAVSEPNEGGQGHVLVDYPLDAGTYTFIIRAVDKAGNEGSATGTFEIQYTEGQTINDVFCNFSIAPLTVSDCNVFVATATFNDVSDQPVPGRLVAIRPASTQNAPPVIEDVFFGGGTNPEIFMLMPTDENGQVRFSIERLVTGSTVISCEISTSDIQSPIGLPVPILATHVCALDVDADECTVSGPNTARVCSPFHLTVTLCDSTGQPLDDKNVGVRVESDRAEPLEDQFFSADTPQNAIVPVVTDANGIALIPVYAMSQGSPTYTVYLNQDGSEVPLGTAQVQVMGTCMIRPDTTCSSVQVIPSVVAAGESAQVQVYLRDSDYQPMAYTTFAIMLTSDRNDWEADPPVVVDLFGDANTVDPDTYHIVTTDANGMAAITVESIADGTAEINVDVLSVYGDVTVGPNNLFVAGTTGDLVDVNQSSFVIDPRQISDANYITQGTITLRNATGGILAGKLFGLRIKSDRNYLPDTPYAVDHFFDTNSIVPGVVPVVTDAEGCIHVPIESVVPGTSQITTEISTTTGWLLIGRQTVQFDDADGDDIPNDDDEYPNDDDRRDCDCDGLPDTIDLNDGMDDDGDGIPNFCDQDCPNLNGVNPVNFQDFSILGADWRQTGGGLPGDLDGNEFVDMYDLAKFALYWLGDCY